MPSYRIMLQWSVRSGSTGALRAGGIKFLAATIELTGLANALHEA